MTLQLIAQQNPLFFYSFLFVFSLCIGSFLNVVIYRIPIMLQRAWRAEAQSVLALEPDQDEQKFNLATPNSTCPHCSSAIKPWQNIPLISYIFLRGRCASCRGSISIRYPAIELFTGIVSLLLAVKIGFNGQLLALLFFSYVAIALAAIDYDTKLLPDNMVLPLLWLGLLLNSQNLFVSLHDAVFGAVVGYGFLWSIFWLFKLVTGKEGMGYGDFKLMAVFGAWFGWQLLPNIILLSSLLGAVIGIAMIASGRIEKAEPIPFGPFIIFAGFLTAVYPEYFILSHYF